MVLLFSLAWLTVTIRGQSDFELGQAFDVTADVTTKKTPSPTQKPVDDDDFNLEDAFGHDANKPTAKPKPSGGGAHVGNGELGDKDLFDDSKPLPDDHSDRDYQPSTDGHEKNQGEQTNMIAGIVGAVGAAAVGAVSSFIAYQKKKLCFKQSEGDPENVNMESHKGNQSNPQGK
ncbi:hypothetical protein GDO86_003004 [Hymenochirus boettgeri]|uniref:CD99 antigen-like protein 2 n=1 Tax=Hymenochirus boettgeri TaxID=247094 RepID=A0A8T2JZ71_9PIPI|nr:hypothetical protein GDO86_003004 [Hymenochirus boettgeri]